MYVSAAALDAGSEAMTSAPVASKVKREAKRSVAVTNSAPGFQPVMAALATGESLLLPR